MIVWQREVLCCMIARMKITSKHKQKSPPPPPPHTKECRSIVRDESSVYFYATAKHV